MLLLVVVVAGCAVCFVVLRVRLMFALIVVLVVAFALELLLLFTHPLFACTWPLAHLFIMPQSQLPPLTFNR